MDWNHNLMHQSKFKMKFLSSWVLFIAGFSSNLSIAQSLLETSFNKNSTDPGWIAAGPAHLTSQVIDPIDNGWLRLTDSTTNSLSSVLNHSGGFNAKEGLSIRFELASWKWELSNQFGMAVFLYDAKLDMTGAIGKEGLGYCKGVGAFLGLGFDAYGSFSSAPNCGDAVTNQPYGVAIRGPHIVANALLAKSVFPADFQSRASQQRPYPKEVQLDLVPKKTGPGFAITLKLKDSFTKETRTIFEKIDFPYPAPPLVRIGFAASLGNAKATQEVKNLMVSKLPAYNINVMVNPSFQDKSINKNGITQMSLLFQSTDQQTQKLNHAFSYQLPKGLFLAQPLNLGGTCFGTIMGGAKNTSLEIEPGLLLRANACTVSFNVTSSNTGTYKTKIEQGELRTEKGVNDTSPEAVLVVK